MSKQCFLRVVFRLFIGFSLLASIPAHAQDGIEYDCQASLAATTVPSGWQCSCPCPTCRVSCSRTGSSGSGSEPSSTSTADPIAVWKARWARAAAARAARKAAKDKQNAAKKLAKEEAQQEAAAARQQAIDDQRQREIEAERQRQLAIKAQRLQAAFDAGRPTAVSSLKGVDDAPVDLSGASVGLGLKGLDDVPRVNVAAKPAWDAKITDPQVAKYARHLGSVVPPLPIPKEEVALEWKKIYLNEDRLMNTADLVVAAWEMTGVLGESITVPCKMLLIGGKTFIAGENGAYMHLVKKDQDYDAALAYLKNPAQSQEFAHLVQDVRQSRPLPAGADPAMVKAARAITDPKLGDTGAVVWDSMTSKEALSAMLRKATLEVSAELLTPSTEGLLQDEAARKAMFDSVRLERTQARKMMELATTTDAQRRQLKAVIEHADNLSVDLYRVEKVNKVASAVADEKIGKAWGDASDEVATHFLGPEAKGREY
jgi:hypothetical protein